MAVFHLMYFIRLFIEFIRVVLSCIFSYSHLIIIIPPYNDS